MLFKKQDNVAMCTMGVNINQATPISPFNYTENLENSYIRIRPISKPSWMRMRRSLIRMRASGWGHLTVELRRLMLQGYRHSHS